MIEAYQCFCRVAKMRLIQNTKPCGVGRLIVSSTLWPASLKFRACYIAGMKDGLIPGLCRTQTFVTTLEMRARQLARDVFSTPAMIGLMERTCVELAEPYLDENEQTVGIHVDVSHLAATDIGQSVTVIAELFEVKGNKLRYLVTATNDQNVKIGDGTHRRAVINTTRFAKRSES
jgi:fluoroacetyl-CoA thioesterase